MLLDFAERVLLQTSNSMNLEDHNFVFKIYTKLLYPLSYACWCSLLSKFQGNSLEVINLSNVVNWQCMEEPHSVLTCTAVYIF